MLLHYLYKEFNNLTPIHFHGVDRYAVKRINLYNGIIQTVLKSDGKKVLGFIDITKSHNPTMAVTLGDWILSDVLLRDEDSVIAVTVESNKVYQSKMSMRESKLNWNLVPYKPIGRIERIDIISNYLQVSDSGQLFNIPLFPNLQPNIENSSQKPESHTIIPQPVTQNLDIWNLSPPMILMIIIISILLLILFLILVGALVYCVKLNNGQCPWIRQQAPRESTYELQKFNASSEEIEEALRLYRQNIHNTSSAITNNESTNHPDSNQRDFNLGGHDPGLLSEHQGNHHEANSFTD